jgi:hypothetical protein
MDKGIPSSNLYFDDGNSDFQQPLFRGLLGQLENDSILHPKLNRFYPLETFIPLSSLRFTKIQRLPTKKPPPKGKRFSYHLFQLLISDHFNTIFFAVERKF